MPRPGNFGGAGLGGASGSGVPAGAPSIGPHLSRRLWRRSEFSSADDLLDLRAIQRFVFQQRVGDDFQLVAVGFDEFLRRLVGLVDDALDLRVNFLRGLLAVILACASCRGPGKHIPCVVAVLHHAELVAHAPVHDHRAAPVAWPAGCRIAAPLEMSSVTISSAMRPAIVMMIVSIASLRRCSACLPSAATW